MHPWWSRAQIGMIAGAIKACVGVVLVHVVAPAVGAICLAQKEPKVHFCKQNPRPLLHKIYAI
jgi:hypothetical protein